MEVIRIVVVDDHPMFRTGLIQAMSLDGDISVVGEGGSAAQAVELARELQPDIVLLDAKMGDRGVDRIGDIIQAHATVRIIMVTASEDDNDIIHALEAGVAGYVLKGTTAPEMRRIVRAVQAGENFIAPDVMGRVLNGLKGKISLPRRPQTGGQLSKQETQVLQQLAHGLSNREIGTQLGITERTVKFHLSNAFAKLQVRNRVEASIIARRMWPTPEE